VGGVEWSEVELVGECRVNDSDIVRPQQAVTSLPHCPRRLAIDQKVIVAPAGIEDFPLPMQAAEILAGTVCNRYISEDNAAQFSAEFIRIRDLHSHGLESTAYGVGRVIDHLSRGDVAARPSDYRE
jgi:hypothetical protein